MFTFPSSAAWFETHLGAWSDENGLCAYASRLVTSHYIYKYNSLLLVVGCLLIYFTIMIYIICIYIYLGMQLPFLIPNSMKFKVIWYVFLDIYFSLFLYIYIYIYVICLFRLAIVIKLQVFVSILPLNKYHRT